MRKLALVAIGAAMAACGPADLEDHLSRDTEALQQCAPSEVVEGMDIYDGQGAVDWAAVKASGIDFAYIKATQGDYNTQSRFAANWSGAKAAGVLRGAYHFFDPTQGGVEQAQHFLSVTGTFEPEDLPPVLDVECPDGDPSCLGGRGSGSGATVTQIHDRILDFLNTVEAATGRRTVIYTFGSYFSSNGISDADFASYPLWIAAINPGSSCFGVPAQWQSADIWQYDWNGSVGGISGSVDLDHFLGTRNQLLAWASGSPFRLHRGGSSDLDGDGRADVCGRDANGLSCLLSSGSGFGASITGPLDDNGGWGDPQYASTMQFGDFDGDGRADLCARGASGITCWRSTGSGFGAAITGPAWSDAAGWGQPRYAATIQFADVNGDGKQDLCARGSTGLTCYLSDGSGFPTQVTGPTISDSADWGSRQYYATLRMVDIDGDGKADLCGRAKAGIVCWRSQGSAFDTTILSGPAWSDAAGWDAPAYFSTIQYADVNGDGKADVCGRGPSGVECWLSNGAGFPTRVSGPTWDDASSWAELAYGSTIRFGDIDGDGKADVCGRSASGVTCYLSDGASFPTQVPGPALSDANGWNVLAYFWTLDLADVTGDGKADLCGRAAAGYRCWPSLGNGFGASFGTTSFSDASGFDAPARFPTVTLVGGVAAAAPGTTTTSGGSGSTGASSGSSGTGTTGSSGSSGGDTTGSSGASGSGASGSTGSPTVPPMATGGCGCSSRGDAGLAWLALAALLMLRGRGRGQCGIP